MIRQRYPIHTHPKHRLFNSPNNYTSFIVRYHYLSPKKQQKAGQNKLSPLSLSFPSPPKQNPGSPRPKVDSPSSDACALRPVIRLRTSENPVCFAEPHQLIAELGVVKSRLVWVLDFIGSAFCEVSFRRQEKTDSLYGLPVVVKVFFVGECFLFCALRCLFFWDGKCLMKRFFLKLFKNDFPWEFLWIFAFAVLWKMFGYL